MKRWTPPDLVRLRAEYATRGPHALAVELERTPPAVQAQARRMQLRAGPAVRGFQPWSAADEFYLRTHYHRSSVAAIARHLGRIEQAVRTKAFQLKLRKKEPWTAAQDDFLRTRYAELTCAELAELFGRTAEAVKMRAHRLGLGVEVRVWTDGEVRLLEERYVTVPTKELAEQLGRKVEEVWGKASTLGLRKRVALSAEAEAVLWELRGQPGTAEWFAREYGIGVAAVERRLAELDRAGGPTRSVGNLPRKPA